MSQPELSALGRLPAPARDAGAILLPRGGVTVVNSHLKVGRRRLALAHELGHYLIADDYTVDWRVADYSDRTLPLESRIDRFARALLLPGAELTRKWPETVDGAVLRLVRDERISGERALDLLQGTFDEVDLPNIRERRPDET